MIKQFLGWALAVCALAFTPGLVNAQGSTGELTPDTTVDSYRARISG